MLGRKLFSLSLALALAESISFPAHAELFKNVKTDGSIETRSFAIDNETDRDATTDDYRNETNTRISVGASFDLLDDVHARLQVDRSPRHGTGAPTPQNIQDSFVFNNGYVKIDKLMGGADLTLGRQFFGNSSDLNIYFGPQGDELLSVTSVDLFRVDAVCPWTGAKFTGIAGKTADAGTGGRGTNTDSTLYGAEIGTDKLIPMGNLAAYYYNGQTHAVKTGATGNNTLTVAGVRANGDIVSGLGYHAEVIQNFGRNNSVAGTPAYRGNAWFLNLRYGQNIGSMPFRARLEGGRGSSDFVAIAPGRRFGLIWGQHSNTFSSTFFPPSTINRGRFGNTGSGLSNLRVFDIGLGIDPIAKLGIDLNAYRFIYDEGYSASLGGNAAPGAGLTSAGTEYDLIVSWKHSDNVSLEVNAATFQVGDALQNTGTSTNPITRLGADIKIRY